MRVSPCPRSRSGRSFSLTPIVCFSTESLSWLNGRRPSTTNQTQIRLMIATQVHVLFTRLPLHASPRGGCFCRLLMVLKEPADVLIAPEFVRMGLLDVAESPGDASGRANRN